MRSETVSSASASSARIRSRVASPAALSVAVRAGKWQLGRIHGFGRGFGRCFRYKDIFMRLSWQVALGESPQERDIPRPAQRASTGGGAGCMPICAHDRRKSRRRSQRRRCARAKSPSNCRPASMPRSISSAASTRRGSGARIVRKTRARPTRCAPSCSIRAGSTGCRGSRPSATWSCFTGWTGRGATSCCRRRAIMPSSAAPSRCARRCGPIRSPCPWRGSSASRATRSRSSASIAWTDTPLLDLKPYFASTDSVPDAAVGWHAGQKR